MVRGAVLVAAGSTVLFIGGACRDTPTEMPVEVTLQPTDLCPEHFSTAITTFEDDRLKGAILAHFGLSVGADLRCYLVRGISTLDAPFRQIETLVGIQNLVSLTWLNLNHNSILDIGPLSALTELRALSLFRQFTDSIIDLSPLGGLTDLTFLSVGSNNVTDVEPLRGLTRLTDLSVSAHLLTDVGPLSGLTALTTLEMAGFRVGVRSQLTDIAPLSSLTNLTRLHLAGNVVADISPLGTLTRLTTLDLYRNSLTDISALDALTGLTTLNLSWQPITDLSPLSGLTSLTHLTLTGITVTDVGPLRSLTALRDTNLEFNRDLSDISPLLANTGLGTGDSVRLVATKVSCSDVAALEAMGVTVTSSCP